VTPAHASIVTGTGPAERIDPATARRMLANLGFLASSDLPDRPGPAYLLVALRPEPTLHHYDPERVDYWATQGGTGVRHVLTRTMRLPTADDVSWGLIRIVDRLRVSNEYLTFGGHVTVDVVDGTAVAVFTSPAPLLRRGGHSQGWDRGADAVGAFFGRLLVAVDYVPGFEAHLATADPAARYAAFVQDTIARFRMSTDLRTGHPELWALIDGEERRLLRDHRAEWTAGTALLGEMATAR
jgi:hypothetical protein